MDELEFKNHLKTYLSDEEIDKLILAINEDFEYMALIIDEDKITKEEILNIYPSLKPHPIVDNVFTYNKNELELGKSLLFEIGAFYIFEPCSSLVSHILNPQEDDLILDMAAAPGGKSIHTSFLMHNKGQIISNEISSSRAKILSSNVEKYGRKNISVYNEDCATLAKAFPNTFTKIILDAPCSGSGMFRKERKMYEDWTLNKVTSLNPIQKELILQAYSMLKEGGEMVYSTCSFSYEEDEAIIEYLLANTDAELINIPYIEGEYRSLINQTIHLLPSHFFGEGHFIAKIRKPGTLTKPTYNYKNMTEKTLDKNLYHLGDIFINKNKEVYLTNHILNKNLHILRNGIKVGQIDPKLGLIYDHGFSRIDLGILPSISLSEDEAISYIFGNQLNKNHPNSYAILKYMNIPFALTKVTKNALKNHYPKGIRKKVRK